MKKTYLESARIYDSIISKSKIYLIGDKLLLNLVRKECNGRTSIYEPGCGTGLITEELAKIPNTKVICSDPSKELINGARKRLKKYKNLKIIEKSAVDLEVGSVDLIVMRYVYHHIQDSEKYKFVKTMYSNLKKNGKIIVLDEFLPFYLGSSWWKRSLIMYHDKKSGIALKLNDNLTAECEQESKKLGLAKKDEFKVKFEIFKKQLKKAGFLNIKRILIKHPKLKNSKSLGMYMVIGEKWMKMS